MRKENKNNEGNKKVSSRFPKGVLKGEAELVSLPAVS
jgi:hypothetical protein